MKHGPVSWKHTVFDRLFTAWIPQSHWRVIGKFIEVVSDAAQLSSETCDLRRVCNMMSYHWRAGQKSCEFNLLRFAQPSNAGRYRLWSQKLFMAGVFCVYTLPYTVICEMGQWWDWKPSWQVNAESEKVSFEKEVAKVWWPCWCIHRTFACMVKAEFCLPACWLSDVASSITVLYCSLFLNLLSSFGLRSHHLAPFSVQRIKARLHASIICLQVRASKQNFVQDPWVG